MRHDSKVRKTGIGLFVGNRVPSVDLPVADVKSNSVLHFLD